LNKIDISKRKLILKIVCSYFIVFHGMLGLTTQ